MSKTRTSYHAEWTDTDGSNISTHYYDLRVLAGRVDGEKRHGATDITFWAHDANGKRALTPSEGNTLKAM